MLIWLQNEFISKLHIIVIFILLINQEGVVVIKLLMKIMKKTMRVQRSVLPEKNNVLSPIKKKGNLENAGFS